VNPGIDCSVLKHKTSGSELVDRSLDHSRVTSDLLLR